MNHKDLIGRRIRAARVGQDWTQAELSRVSGIDRCKISNVEYGRKGISIPTLIVIADALGVTTDYLLGRTGG